MDSSSNIYVADTQNSVIRKITSSGVVSNLAGNAGMFGSAEGTGAGVLFSGPQGVAVDGSGNVYVADSGNSTIRKISPAGVSTTLAGSAGNPGNADGAGYHRAILRAGRRGGGQRRQCLCGGHLEPYHSRDHPGGSFQHTGRRGRDVWKLRRHQQPGALQLSDRSGGRFFRQHVRQ